MKPKFYALLAGAATLVACATYESAETESISEALDFSKLDTFAVRVESSEQMDTAFGPNARDEARLQLVDALEDRGYRERSISDADFVAVFTSAIKTEGGVFSAPYTTPGRPRPTSDYEVGDVVTSDRRVGVVTTYESRPIDLEPSDRLFVLDIVDQGSNVLLWRGYIVSEDTEISDDDTIENAVNEIVEEMPRS